MSDSIDLSKNMPIWMFLVAGPNGAGKSSFADIFLKHYQINLKKLNADEVTLELRKKNPDADQDELNLQAANMIDQEVKNHIKTGSGFAVETVLSSPKYRDDVLAAKEAGFKIGLIYISIYPDQLSPLRVSERVAKGGHDVEARKAIDRYHRSHEQLIWFAPQADMLMVFDNSSKDGNPKLVASRANGQAVSYFHYGINPAVDTALSAAFLGRADIR